MSRVAPLVCVSCMGTALGWFILHGGGIAGALWAAGLSLDLGAEEESSPVGGGAEVPALPGTGRELEDVGDEPGGDEAGRDNRYGVRKSHPSAPPSWSHISEHPLRATRAHGMGTLSPGSTGCGTPLCLSFPISLRQDGPVPCIHDPCNPLTPLTHLHSRGWGRECGEGPPRCASRFRVGWRGRRRGAGRSRKCCERKLGACRSREPWPGERRGEPGWRWCKAASPQAVRAQDPSPPRAARTQRGCGQRLGGPDPPRCVGGKGEIEESWVPAGVPGCPQGSDLCLGRAVTPHFLSAHRRDKLFPRGCPRARGPPGDCYSGRKAGGAAAAQSASGD